MPQNNNSILTIKDFFDRHHGLQRTNRFSMSFLNLPAGLSTVPVADFMPISVQIGARAIDSVADNLAGYGPGRAVPRSQKFAQGVLLSFPVTNDHIITDFYDSWFNLIYSGGRQKGNYATPFQLSYYNDVVLNCQMKIQILDPNGGVNRTFTFFEVYPLESLPIELNMMKNNDYVTYQVLMMYRDFVFKKGE